MNIAVIGLGKLGSVLAAVLADAGHIVTGVDVNEAVVDAINAGMAPVQETDLDELMAGLDPATLRATTDYADAIPQSQLSLIVVPTPSDATGRFDHGHVLEAVSRIGLHLGEGRHTVVVCSTVMPGTMDKDVLPLLETTSGRKLGHSLGLAYSPEFIALGSVIADMRLPETCFVGSQDARSFGDVVDLVRSYTEAMPDCHSMRFSEAELAKLAVNAYVTMKISFAATIAEMCEHLPGASGEVVLHAVGSDSRIGTQYLKPGGAFGGPCFPRDNRALIAVGDDLDVQTLLPWATDEVNSDVIQRLTGLMDKYPTVAILGLAYKPGTSVAERSTGLLVAGALNDVGVKVRVHDPLAFPDLPEGVTRCASAARALDGSVAVLVATPWPSYETINFGGRVVFDAWGITMPQANRRVLGQHCWWWG